MANKREGLAAEIYANGNLYVGEFHDNLKHGHGTYYWFNLLPAEGDPPQHPPRPCQQYLRGKWLCGNPFGQGELVKSNGESFRGEFRNGLKHGQGYESFPNGDIYDGQYVNGFAEGLGEYHWKNGSIYKGEFKQGLRTGTGIWIKGKGSRVSYEGGYQFDKKCGYGVYTWQDGRVYKGHFWDDRMHGQGRVLAGGVEQQVVFENGTMLGDHSPKKKSKHESPQRVYRKQPSPDEVTKRKRDCRRGCCVNNFSKCMHCHL